MIKCKLMNYQDCAFYRFSVEDFEGCPGLEQYGDDDACGDCPYRLENFKKFLKSQK